METSDKIAFLALKAKCLEMAIATRKNNLALSDPAEPVIEIADKYLKWVTAATPAEVNLDPTK